MLISIVLVSAEDYDYDNIYVRVELDYNDG